MRYAVQQHLRSLDDGHDEVVYQNAFENRSGLIRLAAPDVVVLHPTFLGVRWNEDFAVYRDAFRWVASLRCPKLALPQDEYDHSEVLEEWLHELGATHVFSCFPDDRRSVLYPRMSTALSFTETLTGYIDPAAAAATSKQLAPPKERPFDIVYRAAKLPYWFGSHGQLKHRLAGLIQEPASARGLRTDISTRWEDTIFGSKWIDFLLSGRTTIGVESGSSVLDRRGEIQARIRSLVAQQPDITFEAVDAQMPPGWDSYAFFAISPRHLEAVVTKTCQVLVEGEYSGVMVPDRHYVALRRDLSNLNDVLERISDVDACEAIAETAYQEIYLKGDFTSKRLAADLRRAAASGIRPRRVRAPLPLIRTLEHVHSRRHGSGEERLPQRAQRVLPALRAIGLTLARDPDLAARALRTTIGWQPAQWRELARDLVRLAALERSWAAGTVNGDRPWWLAAEAVEGTLYVTSTPGLVDPARPPIEGRFTEIVWDHSAVASVVPLFPNTSKRMVLGLGDHGRYAFRALMRCGGVDGSVFDSQCAA